MRKGEKKKVSTLKSRSGQVIMAGLIVLFLMEGISGVGAVSAIPMGLDIAVDSNATIYVPDDYTTIQKAVDHATAGDTIIVRDGTYIENINVDKRLNIESENGSDNCCVRADAGNTHLCGAVFDLDADNVAISGFTLYGVYAGIALYDDGDSVACCNIDRNYISGGLWGIFVVGEKNIITNNTVNNVKMYGIYIHGKNNTIKDNKCSKSGFAGISVSRSANNTLSHNEVKNSRYGLELEFTTDNTVMNCEFSENLIGILTDSDNGSSIILNDIKNNKYGIYVMNSNASVPLNDFKGNKVDLHYGNETHLNEECSKFESMKFWKSYIVYVAIPAILITVGIFLYVSRRTRKRKK